MIAVGPGSGEIFTHPQRARGDVGGAGIAVDRGQDQSARAGLGQAGGALNLDADIGGQPGLTWTIEKPPVVFSEPPKPLGRNR